MCCWHPSFLLLHLSLMIAKQNASAAARVGAGEAQALVEALRLELKAVMKAQQK